MRNVEIKAKVNDVDTICKKAQELSGGPGTILLLDDTFYNVKDGCLKTRRCADSSSVLVRYSHDEEDGLKLSSFEQLEFSANEKDRAELLDDILQKCLGIRWRVIKDRRLYLVGQTRIHIDTVHGLGSFMELEVVLKDDQTEEEGQEIARDLQRKLGVKDEDLLDCAYVNVLERK